MKKLLLVLFILLFPYLTVCFLIWDFPWFGDWDWKQRLAFFWWQVLFLPLLGMLEHMK